MRGTPTADILTFQRHPTHSHGIERRALNVFTIDDAIFRHSIVNVGIRQTRFDSKRGNKRRHTKTNVLERAKIRVNERVCFDGQWRCIISKRPHTLFISQMFHSQRITTNASPTSTPCLPCSFTLCFVIIHMCDAIVAEYCAQNYSKLNSIAFTTLHWKLRTLASVIAFRSLPASFIRLCSSWMGSVCDAIRSFSTWI